MQKRHVIFGQTELNCIIKDLNILLNCETHYYYCYCIIKREICVYLSDLTVIANCDCDK